MEECKNYESVENDGITVLVSKRNEDVVIATRKRLLEACMNCDEEETCTKVTKLYKELTQ